MNKDLIDFKKRHKELIQVIAAQKQMVNSLEESYNASNERVSELNKEIRGLKGNVWEQESARRQQIKDALPELQKIIDDNKIKLKYLIKEFEVIVSKIKALEVEK